MNEAELINRCRQKDKKAWDVFVQRYSKLIYWSIRKRLSASGFGAKQEDIESIFQEVFLSILEGDKLQQVKDAKTLPAWLAVIGANKTVDFIRSKIRQERKMELNSSILKDADSKQELETKDLINAIGNAINSLSAREKVIISLNLFEGKTHKEIAAIIDMPTNTVSVIIYRVKEKIKKIIS